MKSLLGCAFGLVAVGAIAFSVYAEQKSYDPLAPRPAKLTPAKKVEQQELNIIPRPVECKRLKGEFVINKDTKIVYCGNEYRADAEFLAAYLKTATGFELKVREPADGESGSNVKNCIYFGRFAYLEQVNENTLAVVEPESSYYTLSVSKDRIVIGSCVGKKKSSIDDKDHNVFLGIMTLRQLLPAEIESKKVVNGVKWAIPACEIKDYPRFKWRGMHLDVSRHFYSVEFIKKYIDILALHKMNVFHWHLIDDGGWRLEIKKYPKLTEIGAWRNMSSFKWDFRRVRFGKDISPGEEKYGGFYTQEQVKDVVAYAAKRHITVVPEIEMPGHVMPATVAYPNLMCDGTEKVRDPWGGYRQNIYCAGKEETYKFQQDILDEVLELFPSKYIHIGGDEVRYDFWKKCKHCRAKMKAEKLRNTHELQSYFIKRIEKYLNSKGRIMIGWDEILEGGLAPNAVVMSWRGERGGIRAAQMKHDVVMTPTGPCYFDYAYSNNSTEKCYRYNPVPRALRKDQARYVLGSQGCVWTEYMNDSRRVEYMILPRMSALAETIWTPLNRKDYDSFTVRMDRFLRRLDVMDVHYRMPEPTAKMQAIIFQDKATVEFNKPSNMTWELRYTTDGKAPTPTSPVYTKPLEFTDSVVVKAAIFVKGKSNKSEPIEVHCKKYSPMSMDTLKDMEPGIVGDFYRGGFKSVAAISRGRVAGTKKLAAPVIGSMRGYSNFAWMWKGFVKIEKDGVYTFSTGSDDGSRLFLAETCIVNNDGSHGYGIKQGRVYLKAGVYPIRIGFFQGGGAKRFDAFVEGPGIKHQLLKDNLLFRKK